jgi:hypothetical protein
MNQWQLPGIFLGLLSCVTGQISSRDIKDRNGILLLFHLNLKR